jgi:methyltransferase
MSGSGVAARIEQAIRTYIAACNEGGDEAIAACFAPDAEHYFPTGPKWSGAAAIGGNFSKGVQARGLVWTVDHVAVDADRLVGVLEWSQFETSGRVLRGVDWFVFEPGSLRIREIRAYSAAPVQTELVVQELRDFDYAERGYPTARPA